MSGDYESDDRILPFKVNKDPSILLNNEDTLLLRDDHNQGSEEVHCCARMIVGCI